MVLVVPVHGDPWVLISFPVIFNFVMLLENPDEIHGVFFSSALNTKVVHSKCETDGAPFVLPVAWCEFALCVACFLSRSLRSSRAMMPAWGSPYVPLCTSLCTFLL